MTCGGLPPPQTCRCDLGFILATAVSFWQSYTSDAFSDLVYKRLTWIREDGRWKILQEEAVPPPVAASAP